jgi:hypothetical protein
MYSFVATLNCVTALPLGEAAHLRIARQAPYYSSVTPGGSRGFSSATVAGREIPRASLSRRESHLKNRLDPATVVAVTWLLRRLRRLRFDRDRAVFGFFVASVLGILFAMTFPTTVESIAETLGFGAGPIAETMGSIGWFVLFVSLVAAVITGVRRRSA